MNVRLRSKAVFAVFVVLALLAGGVPRAQAASVDVGWRDGHGHVSVNLPARSTRILVGGNPYYYYDGVYYSGAPRRYIVVQAPVGAVVPRLPRHAKRVWHRGHRYFLHGNVYYARVRGGWQVVRL